MARRWQCVAMVAPILLAFPTSASADEPRLDAEAITLQFQSPACGSAAEFRDQVMLRTPRVRFVERGAQRTIEVHIDAQPSGRLVIVDGRGNRSERSLGAAPCDELLEALALVAAIAIDPSASTKPLAELAPPAPPPAVTVPHDRPPEPPKPPPPPPSPSPWRMEIVAQVGALFGPLPTGIATFGGGVGIEHRSGAWSRSARLTGAWGTGSEASAEGAIASFSSARIDLALDPIRWSVGSFRVGPTVVLGVLHVGVDASGVEDPQSSSRWVPLVTLCGRASLELPPVFVEVELGAAIPLVRERYYISPDLTLYQASVIAGEGSVAVGARFP